MYKEKYDCKFEIGYTDKSLHSMRFIGPPFTFGITQLASNITVRGFNSAVAVGDAIIWMGYDRFYVYDGRVQVLPCSVRAHVFQDFTERRYYLRAHIETCIIEYELLLRVKT